MNKIKVATRVTETKASTALAKQNIQKPMGFWQSHSKNEHPYRSCEPKMYKNPWVFDPLYGESSIGVSFLSFFYMRWGILAEENPAETGGWGGVGEG